MVLARLLASLATAAVMGWLWLWLGREEWLRPVVRHTGHRSGHSRFTEFRLGSASSTTSCTPAASSCSAPWPRPPST